MTTAARVMVLVALVGVLAGPAPAQAPRAHFSALLSGSEQVPPNSSPGYGVALFEVQPGGAAVRYRLSVFETTDVMMAHIHIAPPGQNGPVVVWLYPAAPPPRLIPGVTNGVLGEGTFTAASFMGPLAGQPMSALLTALAQGTAYVNVHTRANPGGEIRGQIR
ncbi:MAG: CHRD domain-containing protein [Armatimonadota bacterium]|nr:CHRD domain-containing protein [Armatimonadota bacterium]MDR7402198.1 CHRD domain-containing protein [Armatimonadota bacterium]MDR7405047.1 CHRD domain-containing protein [Armatimonadota bacterium]MDR7436955.1 CHRD domain-containing protein [Armatimonadota bacterium]MDR7472271.1 CHRD domain-containing protein [Armatimonadota bacterium]